MKNESDTPLCDKQEVTREDIFIGKERTRKAAGFVDAAFARTLERRCKRLEEALRHYGIHDEECVRGIGRPCTCGFAEALAEQKEEKI